MLSLASFADLPAPAEHPNVQVSSPKADRKTYAPGNVATIEVKVKNKSQMPVEALVILDVMLPDGTTERVRSKDRLIEGGNSEKIKMKYERQGQPST